MKSDPKILIVDDEKDLLQVYSWTLAEFWPEAHIEVVSSVEGALLRIQENRPDLLITDILMADQSGLDLCRKVRGSPDWKNIKILAISAFPSFMAQQQGTLMGADDCLCKPFELETLRRHAWQLMESDQKTGGVP